MGTAMVGISVARRFCQEQVHHQEDEDDGLDERLHHLLDWERRTKGVVS